MSRWIDYNNFFKYQIKKRIFKSYKNNESRGIQTELIEILSIPRSTQTENENIKSLDDPSTSNDCSSSSDSSNDHCSEVKDIAFNHISTQTPYSQIPLLLNPNDFLFPNLISGNLLREAGTRNDR